MISRQTTELSNSDKIAPVTKPTYPVPIILIFTNLYGRTYIKCSLLHIVTVELVVKKRRPINKKEARYIKAGIQLEHNLDMDIKAGKYEMGKIENFDVLISKGNIIALIKGNSVFLTVRGLLVNDVKTGWVQVDMGAVPFVCNGANTMSAGINDVSPEIIKGQYVWIREENHHKPLAIGLSLMDAEEMLMSEKGKAIKSLHYIGDKIWNYGVKD